MSTDTQAETTRTARASRLASLVSSISGRARQHPFLTIVVFGAALILGGAVMIARGIANRNSPADSGATIHAALAQLDDGEYSKARSLAQSVQRDGSLNSGSAGGPMFVLGAVTAHDAESHINVKQQKKLYLVAARYLEEARDLGFPAGRTDEGLVMLGRCLFRSGHFAEALPILNDALNGNPPNATEIHGMLSRAYQLDAEPQLERALQHSRSYLEDRLLPDRDRQAALLHQAMIHFERGDSAACRTTLKSLAPNSDSESEKLIVEGRLLIREGDSLSEQQNKAQARGKYDEAIRVLQQAQDLDGSNGGPTRKAQYLLGVCLRRQENYQAAEAQFSRTRWLNFNTPEELAAALEEAEIQQARGRHDTALASLERILHDAGDPRLYTNPWVSLAELRARMHQANERFRADGQFDHAVQLAVRFWPIVDKAESVALEATCYEQWGERRLQDAEDLPPIEAEVFRIDAREQFRHAAEAYSRLAQLRFATNEYPNDLWLAGFNYLRGQNYEQSVKQIKRYLDTERRDRRPRGLVALGESQLALHEIDLALVSLLECVEFYPKHPDTYRARLLAAVAQVENGRLPEAKALLIENLQHESLTPRSREWRDSLFYVGEILFLESVEHEVASLEHGVDSVNETKLRVALEDLEKAATAALEAVGKLDEAVQRYPDAPQATHAHYMIAESYRRASRLPRRKLAVVQVETTRSFLERQIKELLTNAERRYAELVNRLNEREEQFALEPIEQLIQRNSYFGRADALFDLAMYEESIDAYLAATNRYQSEPESLEAFMQVASCYRRLKRPDDARGTIRQAQIVLRDRIRDDADFKRTTRYSRDQWLSLLNWLAAL